MKHKFNCLKSAVPALALSLALLGGITPSGSAAEGSAPFPPQPGIGNENPTPGNSDGEEIQPLSDLDEIKKLTDE